MRNHGPGGAERPLAVGHGATHRGERSAALNLRPLLGRVAQQGSDVRREPAPLIDADEPRSTSLNDVFQVCAPGNRARLASRAVTRLVTRAAWVVAFVTLPLVPVGILVGSGGGPGSSLDLPVVLGLVAISTIIFMVVVSSRLRSLTSGLGIERLLAVHRWLGLVVVGLVLTHLAAVVIPNPSSIKHLDLLHASPGMRAATIATIALVLLAVTALLRRRLRLPYRVWRIVHVVLATAAVAGGAVHVLLLNNLVQADGMRIWFAGVTASLVFVLLLRWVLRPLLAGWAGFRVREVRRESADVSTLVLTSTRGRLFGRRPLHFAPGQFAWLRLRRWGLFSDHPFTIASGARADGTVEFTIRHLGDYTRTLGRLSPGARVFLDGPHGSFSVDHTRATGLVLLAGGVGITPMMSMLRTLADRGDRRPHRLLVSGRSPTTSCSRTSWMTCRSGCTSRSCRPSPSPTRAGPAALAGSMQRCSPPSYPARSAAISSTTFSAAPAPSSKG